MNEIILTNMVMIYNDKNEILVQNRIKNDWPGINFPGGHVDYNESIDESVIREIKEETGLDILNIQFVGFYEWNIPNEKKRHLAMLYKTNSFTGELKSSNEGEMLWININDVNKYKQSLDFDKVLDKMISK